jgi:hypothetical protein
MPRAPGCPVRDLPESAPNMPRSYLHDTPHTTHPADALTASQDDGPDPSDVNASADADVALKERPNTGGATP